MGISINPGGPDDFNDLSTLEINYSHGQIFAPNRLVSRHDLNAKNKLGADIPLSRTSKTVIIQEIVDPQLLDSLLNINGFLATMKYRLGKYVERTSTARPLIFIYPSLTKDSFQKLNSQKRINGFYRFFCDLSTELGLEAVVLPIINDVDSARKIAEKKNLQLIPVLNLKNEINSLTSQFRECKGNESVIPIIAFRFYSFASANLGYNLVMDNLEKLHEGNQATMFVEVGRILPSNTLDISAPHYGSFFFADLVAERYGRKIPKQDDDEDIPKISTPKDVRVFCKNDLVTTILNTSQINSNKFDLDSEKELFSSDKKLQELFVKIVEKKTDDSDWIQNRPMYLSRIHENLQTRPEFSKFQKEINSNSAKEYLSSKPDMHTVVTEHMKLRTAV